MRSTMSPSTTVQFRSGSRGVFDPNSLSAFFEQVLQRTLEDDRTSPCTLSNWNAMVLECDREVCFVAGQLTVVVDVGVEALRNELCCWLDERSDGASSAAPDARG